MAFELPVVASYIDGIPEAVQSNKEGFLIKAGDVEDLAASILQLYQVLVLVQVWAIYC